MMKYPLNSKFSDRITDFVDYKHSLGHSYEESCRILWKFDLFCCDRFPEKSSFDRDIAMAWLEMRDTEGRAGHRNRIMVLREFARYLSAIGDTAYLIPMADFARRIWKCTARYCSMSWCYPTSSLSIAPRLTKRHETAWS